MIHRLGKTLLISVGLAMLLTLLAFWAVIANPLPATPVLSNPFPGVKQPVRDGTWTPECPELAAEPWRALEFPNGYIRHGDPVRFAWVNHELLTIDAVATPRTHTTRARRTVQVFRAPLRKSIIASPPAEADGADAIWGDERGVYVALYGLPNTDRAICMLDPETLALKKTVPLNWPNLPPSNPGDFTFKQEASFPDGSYGLVLTNAYAAITSNTPPPIQTWLYRFDPRTSRLMGPVSSHLRRMGSIWPLSNSDVAVESFDGAATIQRVSWDRGTVSPMSEVQPKPSSMNCARLKLISAMPPAPWVADAPHFCRSSGNFAVIIGREVASYRAPNPPPLSAPQRFVHDLRESLSLSSGNPDPPDDQVVVGRWLLGVNSGGGDTVTELPANFAVACNDDLTLLTRLMTPQMTLSPLDDHSILIIQVVSPAFDLGPAAKQGLIRFGLITESQPTISWKGYVPLPAGVTADYGFNHGPMVFADDDGWLVGLTQTDGMLAVRRQDQGISPVDKDRCWWTRVPYPDGWSYPIRGELRSYLLPAKPAGLGGTP